MLKESIRLNKYISQSGICSRREADKFIEDGKVKINGKKAEFGGQVYPGDIVIVNGQKIEPRDEEEFVFIALNKPVGIVSTTESTEKRNIVDYIGHSTRIFPIGRLDMESQGLIFLTNNGDLVNKILRAGNNHEKDYIVTVNKPVTEEFITKMGQGVPILGTTTKKCRVSRVSSTAFKITLVQGLNRQIRRMCEYFDYEVQKLERTRIMNIGLKGLAVGDWRDLNPDELHSLFDMIKDSSGEAEASSKKKKPANKNASKKKVAKKSLPKAHAGTSGRVGKKKVSKKPGFKKSSGPGGKFGAKRSGPKKPRR